MIRISDLLVVALVCAGTAGCAWSGPVGQGGYGRPPIYGQPVPDHARPEYAYGGSGTFRCESIDGRTRECNADTRGGVRLTRQLSRTQCIEGRNWGYGRGGIWVSQGCRAEFVTGYGGAPGQGGWHEGGYGPSAPPTVRCESNDGRSRHCVIDTRDGVRLTRQISRTQCIEGRNWGWDRGGVWVAQGCRAEFAAGAGYGGVRPGGHGGGWQGQGQEQVLRCESNDGRHRRCDAPIRYGAELVRQISRTQCVRGRNWGWDRGGVWVGDGCRAEFRVR